MSYYRCIKTSPLLWLVVTCLPGPTLWADKSDLTQHGKDLYVEKQGRTLLIPFLEPSKESRGSQPGPGQPATAITLDGSLDESEWTMAMRNEDFQASLKGRAATDPTEVYVMRDDHYLYFGFRMEDQAPESLRARQSVRDGGFGFDDTITIELDTYLNRRDISRFTVNPDGVQSDQIAGGRSGKVGWKGDWFAAARRTESGWSAEFAIPYSILNYIPGATAMGVNFRRYQSRTNEFSWWSDVGPQIRPERMGILQGLQLPQTKLNKAWTWMPFLLAGTNIADRNGEAADTMFTAGIDARYQPGTNLTVAISLNPDFSQVERSVSDISFAYNEKTISDNRPFFEEGRHYFPDGSEFFYSNRAADFDVGIKSFGRVRDNQFGFLVTHSPDDRQDFVGQWVHELNSTRLFEAGIVATSQRAMDSAAARLVFKGREKNGLNYSGTLAYSQTGGVEPEDLRQGAGTHLDAIIGWAGDYLSVDGFIDYYAANYFPALGLLRGEKPGTHGYGGSMSYYRKRSGQVARTVEAYGGITQRLTEDGEIQNRKLYAGSSVELESQLLLSLYAEAGPYRPVTAQRGVFAGFTYDDSYFSASFDFPVRNDTVVFGVQYDWGDLGGGGYNLTSGYISWSPLGSINLKASQETSNSFDRIQQTVLSGSFLITPEDELGCRYIDYSDSTGTFRYYRLTYARRVRRGIDVYVVYDKAALQAEQFSVKLVTTF